MLQSKHVTQNKKCFATTEHTIHSTFGVGEECKMTDVHDHLVPQEDCLPPEAIGYRHLLLDHPVFLMLQFFEALVVELIRAFTL